MKKILLVVDLQPSFKKEPEYDSAIDFIRTHGSEYDTIIATRFINHVDSFFVSKLHYNECLTRDHLDFSPDKLIGKFGYGLDLGRHYKLFNDAEVDIIGCDTDACVLSTCFQLWDHQIPFHILSPYVYSTGTKTVHNGAIAIMKRNFGKDVFKMMSD